MTPQEHREIVTAIGEWTMEQIVAATAPLKKRIEALEAGQKEFRYVGVWAVGKYHKGNFVTHGGSLWHCNDETERQPGKDANAWTLCVKRGKDAKEPVYG